MAEDFDNEEGSGFDKTSKINSAQIVNITLNELWKDFFRHSRDAKYLSSSSDLDCIWTILGGELGVEDTDTEEKYLKIEKELSESGSLQDGIDVRGFSKIDTKQIDKLRNQKKILLKKALFLRRLQNSQGKGTAYHDADEDYMD